MDNNGPAYLAITGPTAVGKSSLALELAERVGGEIVSVDSRQVYRGLDIGTAKPSASDRQRVRHHFVDERDLGEPFSAGRFAAEAADRMDEIVGRGRVPIAVGGSTLYLEALVHGLAPMPDVDPAVGAEVERVASSPRGLQQLYEELTQADPVAAASLDPTKRQRLVRYVGVWRTVHTPPSRFWDCRTRPRHRFQVVVLDRPRPELYRRIERRVDQMIEDGLIDENRRLMATGHRLDANPLRTIGYQEPLRYLEGELSLEEAVALLKRNSRRYAKRQWTWFRRHPDYSWLDVRTASVSDLEGWAGGSRTNTT